MPNASHSVNSKHPVPFTCGLGFNRMLTSSLRAFQSRVHTFKAASAAAGHIHLRLQNGKDENVIQHNQLSSRNSIQVSWLLPSNSPCRGAGIISQSMSSSAGEEGTKNNSSNKVLTLPTMLTLGRVAAIPFLIGAWYWTSPWATAVCTGLFIVAALTDWLDGYLARKMNLSSAFGAFLDPVADKLMVAAVLILLSTQPIAAGTFAGNMWLVPVLTLATIGREITMSALREWAASMGPEAREAVAVNSWGKWKTATQMVSLTLLLLARDGGSGVYIGAAATAGCGLLAVSTWLSIQSLGIYFRSLWKFMAPE